MVSLSESVDEKNKNDFLYSEQSQGPGKGIHITLASLVIAFCRVCITYAVSTRSCRQYMNKP